MANYHSLKNASLIAPTTTVDLGSDTNRYGNVFLSGDINLSGITVSSTNVITPRISAITYVGDDTAANITGGETIILVGSGFNTSASVYVSGTIASVVTVVSSTQITFTSPAKPAGNYALVVVNPDGASATFVPGIQYSGTPTWTTTAGSIGTFGPNTSTSLTLLASSDSTVAYSVSSGVLPDGMTLNNTTGFISGTTPTVLAPTTYNFTVRATDSENQATDRNFSIGLVTITGIRAKYMKVRQTSYSYGHTVYQMLIKGATDSNGIERLLFDDAAVRSMTSISPTPSWGNGFAQVGTATSRYPVYFRNTAGASSSSYFYGVSESAANATFTFAFTNPITVSEVWVTGIDTNGYDYWSGGVVSFSMDGTTWSPEYTLTGLTSYVDIPSYTL